MIGRKLFCKVLMIAVLAPSLMYATPEGEHGIERIELRVEGMT